MHTSLKNWWDASLRHRLLASVLALIIVSMAVLGGVAFRIGRTSVYQEVVQRNTHLALLTATYVNTQFQNIWGNVSLFAYQLQASADMLPFQARALIALRRISPLTYRALYLFDNADHLLIHLQEPLDELLAISDAAAILNRPPIPLTNELSTTYQAARQGKFYVSKVSVAGADQVPIAYMGIPLIEPPNQTLQVVVAEIDLRDLWRRIDQLWIGRTGRAFVVSREGIILAHPDRTYIGQTIPPALQSVLSGYEGQVEYREPGRERLMIASYSPVGKQSGWGVVVEQERAEALAPVAKITTLSLVILIIALSSAVVVTILIARSIIRPLEQLEQVTRTIAQTQILDHELAIPRVDEIGRLAQTFNAMLANLRNARETILTNNAELESRVRERTAQLEAANKELQSFAYVVSHDLKAPLRGIARLTQWLVQDHAAAFDDKGKEMAGLLVNRVQRMDNLIEGILEYSRIGRMIGKEEAINLNQLLRDVIDLLAPPDQIRIEIQADFPTIVGDKTRLEQVFQNLIGNAMKFMDKPAGLIQINWSDTGTLWRFQVADNGPGIEARYHEKIFQIFQTLRPRDEEENTGIGLSIVKKIVELYGGRIWVESTPGQGSTFIFTLPKQT